MASESVSVLLITGPVGVGKTTMGGEVSALLSRAGAPHAFVDVDNLRWCHPSPPHDPFNVALAMRNLAAVWANFRAAGAGRLILADVLESRDDLAGYRAAVPGAAILVVRLRASVATLTGRVRGRELGAGRDWHLHRAAELAEQMERDRVEDLIVDTDGWPVAKVAREIMQRIEWANAEDA